MAYDPVAQVDEVAEWLSVTADNLINRGDKNGWFARSYEYVTTEVSSGLAEDRYSRPNDVAAEVCYFAAAYRQNLDSWLGGNLDWVEPNWRVAFHAVDNPELYRHSQMHLLSRIDIPNTLMPSICLLECLWSVMICAESHIRFDLVRALTSVLLAAPDAEVDQLKSDFGETGVVFTHISRNLVADMAKFCGESPSPSPLLDHLAVWLAPLLSRRFVGWQREVSWGLSVALTAAIKEGQCSSDDECAQVLSASLMRKPRWNVVGPQYFTVADRQIPAKAYHWIRQPIWK